MSDSQNDSLIIALSKGRIYKETLPLLKHAGIELVDDPDTSRKLILDTNHDDVKVLILRATDVPTYVQYGAADVGVAGKDVLMEHGGDGLYEPVDLKIAKCKLMTAGPGKCETSQWTFARCHQVYQCRETIFRVARRTG